MEYVSPPTPAGPTLSPAAADSDADGASRLASGTIIGGYRILGRIGQGGMGTVYKALQPSLGRTVALKLLPARLAEDASFIQRFHREARTLATLNHPNIVTIYDMGEDAGRFFFAMEFVEGVSLREVLRARSMEPREALRVVPQVCDALAYAHEMGVIHRDIKPENLLLTKDGRVKVADFGLARIVRGEEPTAGMTRTDQIMGTYGYMAPEQAESSSRVDHRADIYSLGVVLYEMLTGELPVGHFPPPSRRVSVDIRVDQIVLKSLERDVEQRYQAVSQVNSDVQVVLSSADGSYPAGAANAPANGIAGERPFHVSRGLQVRRSVALGFAAVLVVVGFVLRNVPIGFQGGLIILGSAGLLMVLGLRWNRGTSEKLGIDLLDDIGPRWRRCTADRRKKFLDHLGAYLVVNLGLFLLNMGTSPGYPWFLWPALGWGIGLGLDAWNLLATSGGEALAVGPSVAPPVGSASIPMAVPVGPPAPPAAWPSAVPPSAPAPPPPPHVPLPPRVPPPHSSGMATLGCLGALFLGFPLLIAALVLVAILFVSLDPLWGHGWSQRDVEDLRLAVWIVTSCGTLMGVLCLALGLSGAGDLRRARDASPGAEVRGFGRAQFAVLAGFLALFACPLSLMTALPTATPHIMRIVGLGSGRPTAQKSPSIRMEWSDLQNRGTILLRVDTEDILVRPAEGSEAVVTANVTAIASTRTQAADLVDDVTLRSFEGEEEVEVRLRTSGSLSGRREVEVVVEVPEGAALRILTGGSVKVEGLLGDVSIESQGPSSYRASRVDVEDVRGNVDVLGAFRDLEIFHVRGDVTLRLDGQHAYVELDRIEGLATVEGGEVALEAADLRGGLHVRGAEKLHVRRVRRGFRIYMPEGDRVDLETEGDLTQDSILVLGSWAQCRLRLPRQPELREVYWLPTESLVHLDAKGADVYEQAPPEDLLAPSFDRAASVPAESTEAPSPVTATIIFTGTVVDVDVQRR